MDLMCPRCTEPWDNDELHCEAEAQDSTYQTLAKRFRTEGCGVFGVHCEKQSSLRAEAAGAMYDLLGDDMDGAAAMMDDFEFAGLLDD